ncbi:MAG: uroporphyrinogen decarboxylase family protein [Candidatus Bathyarchaeia archaeon]
MTPWERFEATTHFEEPDIVPVRVHVSPGGYWTVHRRSAPRTVGETKDRYPEAQQEIGVGTPVTPAAWGGRFEQRSLDGNLDSDWWAPTIIDVTDHEKLWVPSREYLVDYLEKTCASILQSTTREQRERHMGGGWSITVMGPGDLACRLMGHTGYQRILSSMYKAPSEVHKLYEILVRSNVEWVNVCKERLDSIRMCRLHDHSLTFLSPKMSEKFGIPYWSREFSALPKETVRWYHNEGRIGSNITSILKMGATAYEFGLVDAERAKELFDGRVTMVGGVNNIGAMLHGSPEEVTAEARRSIETLAPGGGFILQASGGQDVNTPIANSDALYNAAMRQGRYPIRC